MAVEFERPLVLLTLVLVPAAVIVLRHTLVDTGPAQRLLSALVRMAVVTLLVLALAGTLYVGTSRDVAVLVLADLSDSTPPGAWDQVRAFLDALEPRIANPERAGLVAFATAAGAVYPVVHHPVFPEEAPSIENGDGTAIADALQLARQMLPGGAVNRVVLFSDGNETRGDAVAASRQLALHGARVFSVPYEAESADEVLLEELIVPAEVKSGQSFAITATVRASSAGRAAFTLYRDGFKIDERDVDLDAGKTSLTFNESNAGDGLTRYELRVRAANDFFADNNVAGGIVFAAGEPRVLLLEGDEREARYLARALEAEQFRVEAREGKGMPGTLDELAAFDAVIMSDVPATDVTIGQMNALRTYVEDLGGGFIMIGGEDSFGIGGYYRTAIEEALPVRMRSEKKTDTPSLAMMLVVDKSGSMNGVKIELAKEAAIAAVELLGDSDYAGVVAFDGDAYWVVDLQNASNRLGIIQTIESIEAGGGTNIYPGLEMAYDALRQVPATFKHVVLLTDGQSQPGDFQGIVDSMVSEAMTVSSVAVGDGADTELLQDIARWGRGRYYFTADPYDIPQIFTKETMTASKSSLIEEPFLAQPFQPSQVAAGIDWEAAPFLFGYVVTMPKPTAQVPLVTERGEPLLAHWQFGLGKAAAFMSDAKSRWAADWLGWPGYGTFWAQLVRDVMRTSQQRGTETQIAYYGEAARITVDTIDESGAFLNDLSGAVQVVQPDHSVAAYPLAQTAPGRYETTVPMTALGGYLFKIRQTAAGGDGEPVVVSDFTRGFTLSYQPEYRHLAVNEALLREVAESTGGTLRPTLDEVLRVSGADAVPVRHPMWPWLLAAALLLFVLDVALRRLDLAGYRPARRANRYG